MTDHPTPEDPATCARHEDVPHAVPGRQISDAARRALLEAAERRTADSQTGLPVEHGGPSGPEPTRYGDWEKKGLAVDF